MATSEVGSNEERAPELRRRAVRMAMPVRCGDGAAGDVVWSGITLRRSLEQSNEVVGRGRCRERKVKAVEREDESNTAPVTWIAHDTG